MNNPFVILPYASKELFCDRKAELETLVNFVENNTNITFISPRRIGKTGLIYRLFDEISEKKLPLLTFYVDISSSQNVADFNKLLSEAVFITMNKERSKARSFFSALKGVRPVLSFDAVTGAPQVSLNYVNEQQQSQTLAAIFDFLEKQEKRVILAIDEFQTIRDYKGVAMEALLRTYIQPLKNVNFIFCGSKRHIMTDMFVSPRSPFYASTQFMHLEKLDKTIYSEFIKEKFAESKKAINNEAIDFIIDFTRCHTFYTQTLCHNIFATGKNNINISTAKECASSLLKMNEPIYLQYRSVLSALQWKYLIAVAKEGSLSKPMSKEFLGKYGIGTPSSSQRLLSSLLEKEFILEDIKVNSTSYSVYDVFLSRYLERL